MTSDLITAAMWPMLPQDMKDAIEVDITEAGFDWKNAKAVEYMDGKLCSVTVRIP